MKRIFAFAILALFIPLTCYAQDPNIGKLTDWKENFTHNLSVIDESRAIYWEDAVIVMNTNGLYDDSYYLLVGDYEVYTTFIYGSDKKIKQIIFKLAITADSKQEDIKRCLCASIYRNNLYKRASLDDSITDIMVKAAMRTDSGFTKDGYVYYAKSHLENKKVFIYLMVYLDE